MPWKVMVGAEEAPWFEGDVVPIDAASGWTEAWDDIFPDYVQVRYETEAEANAAARIVRAWGFSAATEEEVAVATKVSTPS
jgi:hypothetical protein